jgi:hypothetical protein
MQCCPDLQLLLHADTAAAGCASAVGLAWPGPAPVQSVLRVLLRHMPWLPGSPQDPGSLLAPYGLQGNRQGGAPT